MPDWCAPRPDSVACQDACREIYPQPVPSKFTGTLNKLTRTINRPQLTPADEQQLMQESQRNNRASE